MNEVRFCYQQALQADPTLEGRLVANFVIGGRGNVLTSGVTGSTIGAGAGQCVAAAVRRWGFPAAENGGVTSVSYPFTFDRAD